MQVELPQNKTIASATITCVWYQEIEHFCLWLTHNSCTAPCRHLCKAPEWTSSLKSESQGQCPWERPTAHNSGLIGQAILCVWLIMPVRCEVKHNGVWQPPDSNGLQKIKSMCSAETGCLSCLYRGCHQYNYWSQGENVGLCTRL